MAQIGDIVGFWKPPGPTSHDVIQALRRITGERRIGHAGTLDPLAQGVLVVGIGRVATRELAAVAGGEKEYRAVMRLGARSTTDDAEGVKTRVRVGERPTRLEVLRALVPFRGVTAQVPPAYSAVKVKGRAAYRAARAGVALVLKPRRVEIKKIELLRYRWPTLVLHLVTGPGVYIRALARDLGERLGTGGYLASLTRTRVGGFTKENSLTLAQFRRRRSRVE